MPKWSNMGDVLGREGRHLCLAALLGPHSPGQAGPKRAAPASGTETVAPVHWALFSLGVCDDDEQVRALEATQLDDRARERHARPRNPPVSKAQVQLAFRRLPAPEVTSSWPSFGQPRPISRSGLTNAGRPWVQALLSTQRLTAAGNGRCRRSCRSRRRGPCSFVVE